MLCLGETEETEENRMEFELEDFSANVGQTSIPNSIPNTNYERIRALAQEYERTESESTLMGGILNVIRSYMIQTWFALPIWWYGLTSVRLDEENEEDEQGEFDPSIPESETRLNV